MGATYELAAQYGGITYESFKNWMKRGAAATSGKYFSFFREAASAGTWQAAAWKLERRYPHEYGRQVREITGKDGEDLLRGLTINIGSSDD
jgi:hypothetical protein